MIKRNKARVMNDMNMNVFKMTDLIRYSPIRFLLSRSISTAPTKDIIVAELQDYGRIICVKIYELYHIREKFI